MKMKVKNKKIKKEEDISFQKFEIILNMIKKYILKIIKELVFFVKNFGLLLSLQN
jgi:hypothetical protein